MKMLVRVWNPVHVRRDADSCVLHVLHAVRCRRDSRRRASPLTCAVKHALYLPPLHPATPTPTPTPAPTPPTRQHAVSNTCFPQPPGTHQAAVALPRLERHHVGLRRHAVRRHVLVPQRTCHRQLVALPRPRQHLWGVRVQLILVGEREGGTGKEGSPDGTKHLAAKDAIPSALLR